MVVCVPRDSNLGAVRTLPMGDRAHRELDYMAAEQRLCECPWPLNVEGEVPRNLRPL